MNNTKLIALVLALVLCLGLFAACGGKDDPQTTTVPTTTAAPTTEPTTEPTTVPTEPPMDAETLMGLIDSLNAPVPTSMDFNMQMELVLKQPGMSMTMEMGGEGKALLSTDPIKAYYEMNTFTKMMGQVQEASVSLYAFEEDGEFLFYSYDPDWDSWTKLSVPIPEVATQPVKVGTAVLAEEPVDYNGMECYELHWEADLVTLFEAAKESSGEFQEQWNDFLEGMETGLADIEETVMPILEKLDFSVVKIKILYYVDTADCRIRYTTLEITGLDQLVEQLLQEIGAMLAEDEEYADVDLGLDGIGLELPVLRVEISNISYDPVEVPQLSEEDRKIADEQNYDPKQEDGTYLFKSGEAKFRMTVPEDWDVYYADAESFSFLSGDSVAMINGMICTEYEPDLKGEIESYAEMYEQIYEMEVTTGSYESINGHEVMWFEWDGVREAMMYICDGTNCLQLTVQTEGGVDPYPYLVQLASTVTAE